MVKSAALLIVSLLLPAAAFAQNDPCIQGSGAYAVTSGAPPLVTWVLPAVVQVSATDTTLVPHRWNGVKLKLDQGPEMPISPSPFGAGDPCPAGTPWAGWMPYSYRMTTGVAKGNHSITLTTWRWKLDASGNNTTEIEEAAVTIPFVGVDLILDGPLSAPRNLIIRR